MHRRLILLTAIVFAVLPAGAADDGKHLLKGRILDEHDHPVPKARIVMHVEDDGTTYSGQSDGKGNFKIEFPSCHFISFDVNPPKKSGLARARFQHLSGDATKHFMVRLHHGFEVRGRVIAGNSALKGLTIHVSDPHGRDVHAGGTATTGGGGEFTLMLTPGEKVLEVVNHKFSDLPGSIHQRISISADTTLPDIVIPPLHQQRN